MIPFTHCPFYFEGKSFPVYFPVMLRFPPPHWQAVNYLPRDAGGTLLPCRAPKRHWL